VLGEYHRKKDSCKISMPGKAHSQELYQNGAHVQLSLAQAPIPVKLATSVCTYHLLSLHESRIYLGPL